MVYIVCKGHVKMKKLIRYEIEDNSYVMLEVDEPPPDISLATSLSETFVQAQDKFEDLLAQLKPATSVVLKTLKDLADSPDEATIEFGVKMATGSNIVIASGSVEANFVFKLTWKRKLDGSTV